MDCVDCGLWTDMGPVSIDTSALSLWINKRLGQSRLGSNICRCIARTARVGRRHGSPSAHRLGSTRWPLAAASQVQFERLVCGICFPLKLHDQGMLLVGDRLDLGEGWWLLKQGAAVHVNTNANYTPTAKHRCAARRRSLFCTGFGLASRVQSPEWRKNILALGFHQQSVVQSPEWIV